MGGYLEHVKAQSDEQVFEKSSNNTLHSVTWAERMTPLEDRLSKLLSNIPSDTLDQGLSLDGLRRLLSGKWRGNCHPGELGTALRKLGFVRSRYWSKTEGGFHAKWYPSKTFEKKSK